jgi:hypothetical protein
MIKSANTGKEIVVVTANKIGLLNEIAKLISNHGINIDGLAGYAMDKEAKVMMVTSDNTRAVETLYAAKFSSVKENGVIVIELENKPGALKVVTDKLAAQGIDIKYLYGTACSGGCPPKLVLATSDDQKALVAFNKK